MCALKRGYIYIYIIIYIGSRAGGKRTRGRGAKGQKKITKDRKYCITVDNNNNVAAAEKRYFYKCIRREHMSRLREGTWHACVSPPRRL